MLDRFEVASLLRELAVLRTLEGDDRFRVRAYSNGAEALEKLEEDLATLVEEDRLTEVPAIGARLAAVIAELWRTGSSARLEELRGKHPRGLVELHQVEGLSEMRIKALHQGLGIDSIEKLQQAIDAGALLDLKGFGPKTVERIKEKLVRHQTAGGKIRLADALELGDRLAGFMRRHAETSEAGPLRRRVEVIEEIELVARGAPDLIERFAAHPMVVREEARSERALTVRLADGMRASLWTAPSERWATELLLRTGSPAHVEKLRQRALERGFSLDELELESEEAIYQRLDLPFIPPELREDQGEIESAHQLPRLIELSDVRGMVHCHTTYSDGRNTIEQMALAADALGIEYLTITDHSPSAFYAQGVAIDQLKKQWDEIAEVQSRVKVRLLRGTESDILADGALDYPDPILEQLDIVIASIHSRHKMDETAMTARLIRAMEHPAFKIWGHPLGRLLLRRDPVPCRIEEILDVIARSRAAIEISGDPVRMELEPRLIRSARQRGIRFVVSVDAHSTRALRYVDLGVMLARRGGVAASEVLNTAPVEQFREAVRPSG